MLEKANEYIRQNYIDEKEKPLFHVTPETGWMNDPNGFSVYQGKVHLFYQFYPYKTEWGPMHWGHQVTEDLLKWEAYPVAMAPDQDYDHIGCFSGSAVEADGKHVLLYTGVSQKDGKEIQNQCIAIGDGKTYEKWQDNPVIKGDIMPEKFDRKDFRDPKIWKKDGRYYCVVGNRYEENCGQIVLFSSEDYKNWRYEKVLLRNDGKNGDMLECPDYLEVDGYPVIICSPQNMHAQKYEFHNGHNSIYIIGDAEKEIIGFCMGEKEKPRLWTGLLCTTDNRASGWQADHGRMDEVVGCTCHDKRTEMAGNDDTPKRIKNQRWENLAKSGERTGKV